MAGAYLILHGYQSAGNFVNSDELFGALLTGFGLLCSHWVHADAPPPAANNSTGFTRTAVFAACLGLMLGATACTHIYTNGCVTTVQNRFFGMDVEAAPSSTSPGKIMLGAGSSMMTVYPTSTNVLYAAPYFSTATAQSTANPFNVGISETIGAGSVSAEIGTNGTSEARAISQRVFNIHQNFTNAANTNK